MTGHQKPVHLSAKQQIEESCGINYVTQKACAVCITQLKSTLKNPAQLHTCTLVMV